MSTAHRPARAFDVFLGSKLEWARSGPHEDQHWLLLCFGAAGVVRVEGSQDGVSLACIAVEAAPPQVRPKPTPFELCVGRVLVAVTPRLTEYESEQDELGPSGICLEFDGGRRVCVRHSDGELILDRTGRSGDDDQSLAS